MQDPLWDRSADANFGWAACINVPPKDDAAQSSPVTREFYSIGYAPGSLQ